MNREILDTQWKLLASQNKLTARHYFQRALLIALTAKNTKNVPREDIVMALLQKYFTPVTNANELANGRSKDDTVKALAKMETFFVKSAPDRLDILGIEWDTVFTTSEWSIYADMVKNINFDRMGRKYVYYFTVQDIMPVQQGVQAGHALFKLGVVLGKQKTNYDPNEIYFQWIGVKDELALADIASKHSKVGYVVFKEPDLGNKITTVAFMPILWNNRDEFAEYELLTHYIKE